MIYATRRLAVIAGLEAAIPDAAALVFACLGVALALHGRRAIRPRILNVAAMAAGVFMNAIAAAPGWRNLAVWAMPPVAYALASDTLIGVVRAWVIARHRDLDAELAPEEVTPLAMAGGLILWLLRLALAPASTLTGLRTWVLEQCPVAPGRRAPHPAGTPDAAPPALARSRRGSGPRGQTKTARFLVLVTEQHGPLATIPLGDVAKIAAAVAPRPEPPQPGADGIHRPPPRRSDQPGPRPGRLRRQRGPDHLRQIHPPQQHEHRKKHMGHPAPRTPSPPGPQPHRPVPAPQHPRPGPPPPRQHPATARALKLPARQLPLDLSLVHPYREH